MDTEALLQVEDLQVSYGAARAVSHVSLAVPAGSAVAVLGANGAGKSSLARALSGLVRPTGGRVRFGATDITGMAPHRVRRLGLTYLPEGRGVFPDLTVAENLRMSVRWLDSRQARSVAVGRALELFPVLGERRSQRAGTLSGGEQQMLSLARGLADPPRLLIADELSLGLAPKVVDAVFDGLAAARELGISIVLIEQFVHRALAFADTALILRRGDAVWAGDASVAKQDVLDRYLGDDAGAA